jgi:hypothetical protein
MFNIAKMKPAPETGRGLFESDGGPGQRRSAVRIGPGGIGFAPEMMA